MSTTEGYQPSCDAAHSFDPPITGVVSGGGCNTVASVVLFRWEVCGVGEVHGGRGYGGVAAA